MEQIKNKLIFNYISDLRKKEIDKFERAELIQNYLIDNKMSQREFAKQFGFKHSTIQDWLQILKITKEEYTEIKEKGYNETDVYRMIRNNKKEDKEVILTQFNKSLLNFTLTKCTGLISPFVTRHEKGMSTTETLKLINELRNLLNRLEMKMERIK